MGLLGDVFPYVRTELFAGNHAVQAQVGLSGLQPPDQKSGENAVALVAAIPHALIFAAGRDDLDSSLLGPFPNAGADLILPDDRCQVGRTARAHQQAGVARVHD